MLSALLQAMFYAKLQYTRRDSFNLMITPRIFGRQLCAHSRAEVETNVSESLLDVSHATGYPRRFEMLGRTFIKMNKTVIVQGEMQQMSKPSHALSDRGLTVFI